MLHPNDGILLIDKNEGVTSHDVVKAVKSRLGVRKAGHAGTLDPFATGLLIVLLGQGTKLSSFLMSRDKVYLAETRLGIETDTLDPTGKIVRTSSVDELSLEYIRERAQEFVGRISQVPPLHSAVKIEGVPSYRLARKGIAVELEEKEVNVHSIKVVSVALPDIVFEIHCSSGTYIRSLAADLGRALGPGAHLKTLRRLSSGSFQVQEALKGETALPGGDISILKERIIPLRKALPWMKEIEVNDLLAKKIRNGYQPAVEELLDGRKTTEMEKGYAKLLKDSDLVAIVNTGHERSGKGRVRLERVFS